MIPPSCLGVYGSVSSSPILSLSLLMVSIGSQGNLRKRMESGSSPDWSFGATWRYWWGCSMWLLALWEELKTQGQLALPGI